MAMNNNENLNSQIEEINVIEVLDTDDVAALKEKIVAFNTKVPDFNEKVKGLNETNRQLFARAKNAEDDVKELRGKVKEVPEKKSKAKPDTSDEFDEMQLMFLENKGISTEEDVAWVKEELSQLPGGTLMSLFKNKYFQSSLKERQDTAKAVNASPKGGRSSGNSADTVEHHLAQYLATGVLPENQVMAEKVIEARITAEKAKSSNPFNNARPAGSGLG